MKTTLKVEHPADIEFTLTVTMPLKEWEELHKTIIGGPGNPQAIQMSLAIYSMLDKARQHFIPDEPRD